LQRRLANGSWEECVIYPPHAQQVKSNTEIALNNRWATVALLVSKQRITLRCRLRHMY
jgi:hypothetical protein